MTSPSAARRLRAPSVEALVIATYGLFGLRLGARPISDNSALLHLRTGMDMVRDSVIPAIPRADPYSFTARGEPWVVQSWLPSTVVGWVERGGGIEWVVVAVGLTMAALAALVATLARAGDVRRTVLSAGAALAVSTPFWTPRPLLVGLLCLGGVIWVVERRKSPWWLLAIAWVWVNSHGSFALGLGWLLLRALGDAVDERARPRLDAVAVFAGGLVLGAVNPLGPRLLTFPLTVGEKSEIFRTVIEWRTVDFQKADGLVALFGIVAAVVVLTATPLDVAPRVAGSRLPGVRPAGAAQLGPARGRPGASVGGGIACPRDRPPGEGGPGAGTGRVRPGARRPCGDVPRRGGDPAAPGAVGLPGGRGEVDRGTRAIRGTAPGGDS